MFLKKSKSFAVAFAKKQKKISELRGKKFLPDEYDENFLLKTRSNLLLES